MRRSLLLLSIPLSVACSGGGGDGNTITPPAPVVAVASVSVGPASSPIAVGATVQLSAVTKDASGNTLAGRTVSWNSTSSAIATVSASGLVTGVAAGTAYIRATSEAKSDSTQVTVGAPSLAYSAWKISANAGASTETPLPADTTDLVLIRARQAYTAVKSFWTTPTTGAAIPTLWFVPSATTIGSTAAAAGLYISDSLPGSAPGGTDPFRYIFATPNTAAVRAVDDSTLAAKWTLTSTSSSAFALTAQFPDLGDNYYVPNHPTLVFECIGTFRSPYVIYTISFTGSGTTATGTLTYTFRNFTQSCARPNTVKGMWTMTIPFTATRVR